MSGDSQGGAKEAGNGEREAEAADDSQEGAEEAGNSEGRTQASDGCPGEVRVKN